MRDFPSLFVAADTDSLTGLAVCLKNLPHHHDEIGVKINLDLVLQVGYNQCCRAIPETIKVRFLDLKMWNGKRTMLSVVKEAVKHGFNVINIHALAEEQARDACDWAADQNVELLFVTVLSHYDDDYCQHWFRRSMREMVTQMAEEAMGLGARGIILPGTMLEAVDQFRSLRKVATGIRDVSYRDDRHAQEVSAFEAVANGASAVVVGSPITKAEVPHEALEAILKQIYRGKEERRNG